MEFTIRPIEATDSRDINALRRMPGVFETILGTPAERISYTEKFITGMDGNSHQFVAVVTNADGGETVIGTAALMVSGNNRLRHSAGAAIMIHKDYQNAGVGTALMKSVLDMADNWLMLVRVELTVFADNDRALHLYEKMGFEKEGLRKMAAIRNGEYADEFSMARIHPKFR